MPTLEAPTIETFEPVDSYRALGVGYITMCGPGGVRLDISEAGAVRIDEDPNIAPLLARMGDFVARHGMYKATTDVHDREPCGILRVAESRRKSEQWKPDRVRLASVYHPDAAPSVIVKAHDYHHSSSAAQLYMGAWLHKKLANTDTGLRSPAQLAMLQARGSRGHRTTVMDHVPGKNMHSWAFSYRNMMGSDFIPRVHAAVNETAGAAHRKLQRALGWRGWLIANDVRNTRNLILADPDRVNIHNLADQELTVIDQPSVRSYSRPGLALARHLPVLGGALTEQPTLLRTPAALSE